MFSSSRSNAPDCSFGPRILFLLLLLLLFLSLRFRLFPFFYDGLTASAYWFMGGVTTVGVALSVFAHEMARPLGRRTHAYWNGIFVSFFLACVLFAVAYLWESKNPNNLGTGILFHLAAANLSLGFFQMLPALPLDGGRYLLRVFSRHSCVRPVVFHLGNLVGLLFVGCGIYHFARSRPVLGAWLAVVGSLLLKANLEEFRE